MSTHHTTMTTAELEEAIYHYLTMVRDGDIEHAEEISDWLAAIGITSNTVTGREMPKEPRQKALWFASWFQELAMGQRWDSMDYLFKAFADENCCC